MKMTYFGRKRALSGRLALVTGGTRGIGKAIAERLLADGARVIVTGKRPNGKPPKGCDYVAVDFADATAVRHFADRISKLNIDILVNNAGINKISSFEKIESRDFETIQQVNVHAPFYLCRAAVKGMHRRGWGRIINIASIYGTISREFRGAYSTSKAALYGMTKALAAEVARSGVLCNCVSPGFIDTELTRSVLSKADMARMVKQIPIQRFGSPHEVASLVHWLVSPENTYISGQNIIIDGGFTRV